MQLTRSEDNHGRCQHQLLLKGAPIIESFTQPQVHNVKVVLKENTLLFVRRGRILVKSGSLQQLTNSDEMVFFKKGIAIEFEAVPDVGVGTIEYLLVSFPSIVVNQFVKIAKLPSVSVNSEAWAAPFTMDISLLHFIDGLQGYIQQAQNLEEGLLKIKLFELLFYLSHYCPDIFHRLLQVREAFHADVTNTMEENVLNALSLQELAALAGRSVSSFRRDFWAMYNMAPSRWIRQKRLEKARELLEGTNMTITDICYTTGFDNIAHFSRLFKSHFHHSPSAYRQAVMQR